MYFPFPIRNAGGPGAGHILLSAPATPIAFWDSIGKRPSLCSLKDYRRTLRLGHSVGPFLFIFTGPFEITVEVTWVGMQNKQILNLITLMYLV